MRVQADWRLKLAVTAMLLSALLVACGPETVSTEGEDYEAEMQPADAEVADADGADADGADADSGDSGDSEPEPGQEPEAEPEERPFKTAEVEGFEFSWRIEGDNIRLRVGARTTGWVAVGFDPDSVMRGANMLIGFVAGDNQTLEDHYGNTLVTHIPDVRGGGSDDIIEYSMQESDGFTSFEALIPLDSGDERDSVLTEGGTHRVIFAHGPDNGDNTFVVHVRHAAINVEL